MAACDIDDLIASFSSTGHISQEAIDLAALQSQLSNSLMHFASAPCPTTPTMSTMELSPAPRISASYTTQSQSEQWADQMDEEMVEESLLGIVRPSDKHRSTKQQPHQYHQQHQQQPAYQSQPQFVPTAQYGSVPSTNEFTAYAAMDPFFAAQLQAAQAPPSYYGQITPGYGFAARQPTMATPTY